MSQRARGFTTVLVRAGVVPALAFLAVVLSLVGSRVIAANTSASDARDGVRPSPPHWQAAYSRRFPGCVATVLWPAHERPVAFVVKHPSGRVTRIAVDEAVRRARTDADRVWTIGACRSPADPPTQEAPVR